MAILGIRWVLLAAPLACARAAPPNPPSVGYHSAAAGSAARSAPSPSSEPPASWSRCWPDALPRKAPKQLHWLRPTEGNAMPAEVRVEHDGSNELRFSTRTGASVLALEWVDGALAVLTDAAFEVWDISGPRLVARFAHHSESSLEAGWLSRDGRFFAVRVSEREARLFDADGNAYGLYAAHQGINDLAFSEDTRLLGAACSGLLEIRALRRVGHESPDGVPLVVPLARLLSSSDPSRSIDSACCCTATLDWSSGDAMLAAATCDGRILVFDGCRADSVREIGRRSDTPRRLRFAPAGSLFATLWSDGTLEVWDARSGLRVAGAAGVMEKVRAFAFAPDGRALALGLANDDIVLCTLGLGACRAFVRARSTPRALSWSRDGRWLAAALDTEASLWKIDP